MNTAEQNERKTAGVTPAVFLLYWTKKLAQEYTNEYNINKNTQE